MHAYIATRGDSLGALVALSRVYRGSSPFMLRLLAAPFTFYVYLYGGYV